MSEPTQYVTLSWSKQDPENKLGIFRGGQATSPNNNLTFTIALLSSGLFFAFEFFVMKAAAKKWPALTILTDPITRPDNLTVVIPITILFFWCIAILFIKGRKIRFQEKALTLATVPQQVDFVLNEESSMTVLQRIGMLVDSSRHFILLNRIDRALSNLKNVGGVSDVSTILKDQADNDESTIISSYMKIQGFVWAIPVLGFIGTVMGLSTAIGNFAGTLNADTSDISAIKSNLTNVTGGLSVAFETTLIALVAALIIQLYSTRMQERENKFLDDCNDYCHSHVTTKLRMAKEQDAYAQYYYAQAQAQQAQVQAGQRGPGQA
jgi:biopolymer transport protein ExbB/TolQ